MSGAGVARGLDDRQVQELFEKLDRSLATLEALPDEQLREEALTAVEVLLNIYGEGLGRIASLCRTPEGVPHPVLVEDELVAHLLMLHDIHPVEVSERASRALDEVRPYLRSHGGDVELLGIESGVARVRLTGSCNGCPSSSTTLKATVEEALIGAVPEIASVHAEEQADPNPSKPQVAFIPIATVGRKPAAIAGGLDG